jgi:hypothetical protein
MQEILRFDIGTDEKVETIIDRETGAFNLSDISLKLNILKDNKAVLIDIEDEAQLLIGYKREKIWRFETPGIMKEGNNPYISENEDPFVAAIQILYDIYQFKMGL